jgi:hypothetical protein
MTNKTDLQAHALWYAWGQQDAGIGREVDAIAFAQHFRRLDDCGTRPSIQDAWKAFIAPSVPEIFAAIDDSVAAFLAKSIDEAGMADLDAIDNEYVDEDATRGDR